MRFIIFGGGCYGTFYARQLVRAAATGALPVSEALVVDRNAVSRTERELGTADGLLRFVHAEWEPFLAEYLPTLPEGADDVIVPPPFTPHLALAWILERLRRERPEREWRLEPFGALPDTPFQRQAEGGPLVVSHADWICPVHCIEPEVCPHTRGPRDWDLERTVHEFAGTLSEAGQPIERVHLFLCHHLAFGVGGYPAARIITAFRDIRDRSDSRVGRVPPRFIVGTVSHCHGALHLLTTGTGTLPEPDHIATL